MKETRLKLKKRHFSLSFTVLILSIFLYRAIYIAYHIGTIKLGRFSVERLTLVPSENNSMKMEVRVNMLNCKCPLYIEFINISGRLYSERHNNSSNDITLSVENIKFDKKKPLNFTAVAEITNNNFDIPLLDLITQGFRIDIRFIVRARFCLLPVCFSKIIRKRKSDLFTRHSKTIYKEFLAARVHTLDGVPCIQLGIKKKFFTEVNSNREFVLNAGCLKVEFEGMIEIVVIVTSFSTQVFDGYSYNSKYHSKCDGHSRDCDTNQHTTPLHILTNIIPGICEIEGGDTEEVVIFYFLNIPIANLNKVPFMYRNWNKKYLRLKKISVLRGNWKGGKFLGKCLGMDSPGVIRVDDTVLPIYDTTDNTNTVSDNNSDNIYPYFIPLGSLNNLTLLGSSTNNDSTKNSDNPSTLHIKDWNILENSFSVNLGFNPRHPITKFLNTVHNTLDTSMFGAILYKSRIELSLGDFSEVTVSLNNNSIGLINVTVKASKNTLLTIDSIKSIPIVAKSVVLGGILVSPEIVVYLEYPWRIRNDYESIYEFSDTGVCHSVIVDHLLSDNNSVVMDNVINNVMDTVMDGTNNNSVVMDASNNSLVMDGNKNTRNNTIIDTTIDLSTYGFLNKKSFKHKEQALIEFPKFTLCMENSCIKIRTNFMPGEIKKIREDRYEGRIIARSFVVFQGKWKGSEVFKDEYFVARIGKLGLKCTVNELISMFDDCNDNCRHNNQSTNNNTFFVDLPFKIAQSKFHPGKFTFNHYCNSNKDILLYALCKDPSFYVNHSLHSQFKKIDPSFSCFDRNVPFKFFIRNVVRVKKALYTKLVGPIPVSIEGENITGIFTMTSKNILFYFPEIVSVCVKMPYSVTDRSDVIRSDVTDNSNVIRSNVSHRSNVTDKSNTLTDNSSNVTDKSNTLTDNTKVITQNHNKNRIHATDKDLLHSLLDFIIDVCIVELASDNTATTNNNSVINCDLKSSGSGFSFVCNIPEKSMPCFSFLDMNPDSNVKVIVNQCVNTTTNQHVMNNKSPTVNDCYVDGSIVEITTKYNQGFYTLEINGSIQEEYFKAKVSFEFNGTEFEWVDINMKSYIEYLFLLDNPCDDGGGNKCDDSHNQYKNNLHTLNVKVTDINTTPTSMAFLIDIGIPTILESLGNSLNSIYRELPVEEIPGSIQLNVECKDPIQIELKMDESRMIFGLDRIESTRLTIPLCGARCGNDCVCDGGDNDCDGKNTSNTTNHTNNTTNDSSNTNDTNNTNHTNNTINTTLSIQSNTLTSLPFNLLNSKNISLSFPEPINTIVQHNSNTGSIIDMKTTGLPLLIFDLKIPVILNFIGDPLVLFSSTPVNAMCVLTGPVMNNSCNSHCNTFSIPVLLQQTRTWYKLITPHCDNVIDRDDPNTTSNNTSNNGLFTDLYLVLGNKVRGYTFYIGEHPGLLDTLGISSFYTGIYSMGFLKLPYLDNLGDQAKKLYEWNMNYYESIVDRFDNQ